MSTRQARRDAAPDASMSLLRAVISQPLDPAYAAAAARSARSGDAQPRRFGAATFIVVMLSLGLLFGIASGELRSAQSPRAQARSQLASQIDAAQRANEATSARVADLQREVNALEARSIGDVDTVNALAAASAVAGTEPARGPGLLVRLDDAADASNADGEIVDPQGRVYSKDLVNVVNSLWQAGAEAISINGQRLTGETPIRFAGAAIIVGFRPMARPYVISAVGPPETRSRFVDGPGGDYLEALRALGIEASSEEKDEVTVPPAVVTAPRYARPNGGASE